MIPLNNENDNNQEDYDNIKQNEIQKQQEVILKEKGWRECMNHLYDYSKKTGYIQEHRLSLNVILPKYSKHSYKPVEFQVTINCSKPEIIVGQTPAAAHYSNFEGKCVICYENVGSPKRKGLRVFEFDCNKKHFFRQFPPYPYFTNHNIIIDRNHQEQVLTIDTIKELMEISHSMPGYRVASNSDREGTGVTNLSHRHYQAGDYRFAVYDAAVRKHFKGYDNCDIQWLNYPCCAIKVTGNDRVAVEKTVDRLFSVWRNGEFPNLSQPLQTASLISTYDGPSSTYEFIIFPRNAEQPRFLTRATLQCLKKEFVGIFELCGYAILPGRLKDQLVTIENIIEKYESAASSVDSNVNINHSNLILPAELEIFREWLNQFYFPYKSNHNHLKTKDALSDTLQNSFISILQDNSPISDRDDVSVDSWINQCKFIY